LNRGGTIPRTTTNGNITMRQDFAGVITNPPNLAQSLVEFRS
jgi:hypothetical protein